MQTGDGGRQADTDRLWAEARRQLDEVIGFAAAAGVGTNIDTMIRGIHQARAALNQAETTAGQLRREQQKAAR